MKTALMILLFASSSFAQGAPSATGGAAAPDCAPADFKFEVKSGDSSRPVTQPEPGRALLYFLQEDKVFESCPGPTVKWGMDGNWVGATQSNTYFYVSVESGEHHLCSEWQTAVIVTAGHQTSAAHFTAEAGQAYYFRAQDFFWGDSGAANITLGPIDSDQAQLLITKFGFSALHPKQCHFTRVVLYDLCPTDPSAWTPMFCPNCEAEYRPGFTRCSDCEAALVERLDEADVHSNNPELTGRPELLWTGMDAGTRDGIVDALETAKIS